MVEAGLIVIVSFISPFRSERRMARALFAPQEFIEIYVDTPLEICEARDPKGLYKLARAGKLPNLTGIGSAYEPPENAELVLTAGAEKPGCAHPGRARDAQRAGDNLTLCAGGVERFVIGSSSSCHR